MMKKQCNIATIFLIFLLLLALVIHAQNCSREIAADIQLIDGKSIVIQPGETVCLLGGSKDYLLIRNVHGTAERPVTFINKNGAIVINTDHYYGMKIADCSFIRILGNGDSGIQYGIQIQRVGGGAGLSVGDLSTNVEIAFMEIAHTAIAGVYAKTDPTCDNFSSTRDKFTMYNFWLHDCYIHDTQDEGLYIGSSKYTGQHLLGCDTTVFPHVIRGVRIFNNLVENTGWDGIQVSSADENCSIYDNTIRFDSRADSSGQMSGILLGGGSKCKTYNNRIIEGNGDGIDILGLGNHEVFNNLIVRAGKNYHPNNPNDFKHGIYVGQVVTDINAILGIYNNTIVEPKSFGITISNSEMTSTQVINNLITDPGQFPLIGNNAYINNNVNPENVQIENNYLNASNVAVRFLDYATGNFDLQPSSPAVNYGKNLSSQGVTFDILNRSRPFHTFFDAGAFETHDPYADIKKQNNSGINKLQVFPNPLNQYLNVSFSTKQQLLVTLEIVSMEGRIVIHKQQNCTKDLLYTIRFDIKKLQANHYLLKLSTKTGVKSEIITRK